MSPTFRNSLFALVITVILTATVVYAVNYLDRQRVSQINDLQTQLATDTLSVETQFALLEESPCEVLTEDNTLSLQIASLGERLSAAESSLGSDDEQVLLLKQQYTLLQIRDYILTNRLAETCNVDPTVVLYFYSNEPDACEDCDRAAYGLSYLHDTNPQLRVYAFDYNLDLGALKTLIALERIEPEFPAFVVEGETSYGFTDVETFAEQFPENFFATSTATSTPEDDE